MAANEEYADQRPGCQFFIQIAYQLGINMVIPPESDLMSPPLLYGINENTHMLIKLTERKRELEGRLASSQAAATGIANEMSFLRGALDDLDYMWKTWVNREPAHAADFKSLFGPNASNNQP